MASPAPPPTEGSRACPIPARCPTIPCGEIESSRTFLPIPHIPGIWYKAAALSDVLERLTTERAELANGVDNEHPALVAFMKYQNIETLNREILIELVDHIKVYENGNIKIKFKFADELRKIAEYIEINTSKIPAVAG